jgi:hypothetical protein
MWLATGSVKGAIDHEIGHAIDHQLGISERSDVKSMYALFMSKPEAQRKKALSKYSGTNIKEFVAECWSASQNQKAPTTLASEVANIIFDAYRQANPQDK